MSTVFRQKGSKAPTARNPLFIIVYDGVTRILRFSQEPELRRTGHKSCV